MSAAESTIAPFTAFSFEIVLSPATPLDGVGDPICEGAFAECDGLSIDMEPLTVMQGGSNDAVTHLIGHSRPGQVTLRRGMTTTNDLWAWMALAGVAGRDVSANGQVTMYDAAGEVQARIRLGGCLPVRLRGPALHGSTGLVAVEELGLAVGHLMLDGASQAAGGGLGLSVGAQVSGGIGLSGQLGGTLSASAGASGSFGASASAGASGSFGGGIG